MSEFLFDPQNHLFYNMYNMKNRHLLFSVISFVLALSAMLASVFALDSAQLNINGSLGYTQTTTTTAITLNNTFKTTKPDLYEAYNNLTTDNLDGFWQSLRNDTSIDTTNLDEIIERLEGFLPLGDYFVLTEDSLYQTKLDKKNIKFSSGGEPQQDIDEVDKWRFTLTQPLLTNDMTNIDWLVLDLSKNTLQLYDIIDFDSQSKDITHVCSLPIIAIMFYL